ncbi:pentapeptide repeat-containing protein [Streptomyces sp. NPDC004539]|uniref:pentapeptide repeat-containing protein n=1 Tax=Streptomyces sp. NPDC004539 TaxID=3154280 RepID=UPI0033A5A3AD
MSSLVPTPRELIDLPYARYLEPFHGNLNRSEILDSAHVDGVTFEDMDADYLRAGESVFTSVMFSAGRMRRARLNDVWLHTVRWVATELGEAEWTDVEVRSGSLSGLELISSKMRRVTFYECKLDSVNLRAVNLRDVSFVDCTLRNVDFGGAILTNVTFPGSKLEGVQFTKARMKDVDLRQAVELGITDGFSSLGGSIINSVQMMNFAPALCQALNITVKDR